VVINSARSPVLDATVLTSLSMHAPLSSLHSCLVSLGPGACYAAHSSTSAHVGASVGGMVCLPILRQGRSSLPEARAAAAPPLPAADESPQAASPER
jgi:hypothetical protein